MNLLLTAVGSLLLLSVAAFCAFGFLATFEPTTRPGEFLAFRIGYATVGLGCIAGAVLLIVTAMRK
jgi:hypothetical protein